MAKSSCRFNNPLVVFVLYDSTEILCEVIDSSGLGDDLDTDTWTVFAPTNGTKILSSLTSILIVRSFLLTFYLFLLSNRRI